MASGKRQIYTVSQVNGLIKTAIEDSLPGRLTVSGEISGWKVHGSGHCYFSLKDENSVLPCVMWRSSFAKLKFRPEDGMAILGTGYIDVYPPQGKFQFYVERMEPAGVGALALAFEQMKERLTAEGLFKEEHKRPLPPYPNRICIVTSESGAAVHDITDSIWNRWPCVKLSLYPVPVQGEGAAEKIAAAIRNINRRNKNLRFDMMIVGRGGGSLEDLWAFNEEVLARAIFDSQIPIVSAVGHEVDTTIADLVADVRASTPTKAGVVAVPDINEVQAQLDYFEENLAARANSRMGICREMLQTILASAVFKNPLLAIRMRQQRVDELGFALTDSVKDTISLVRAKLNRFYEKVLAIEPHRLLAKKTVELNNAQNRAKLTIKTRINEMRIQLTAQSNRLEALNPKSVLKRGYSITINKVTGALVRRANDIEVGQIITTELANENLIESKVTKK
jgi:exodeoxyribonuclease VII large subunit